MTRLELLIHYNRMCMIFEMANADYLAEIYRKKMRDVVAEMKEAGEYEDAA